jgi:hypothetical protein
MVSILTVRQESDHLIHGKRYANAFKTQFFFDFVRDINYILHLLAELRESIHGFP